MIPNNLDDWSLDIVKELIEKLGVESDRHDFKKDLPDTETLTKACCSFANSKGGFIIFGVKEKNPFEIVGIDKDKELAHKFGQKIKANPTIEFSLPKIITIPETDRVIAIFEIPLSPERPHVPEISPEKRLFQKRTNKGNDYMSYEEIKFSFQDYQERREKLKLLYMELTLNLEQVDSMKIDELSLEKKYSLIDFDNTIINGLLSELYSSISKDKELVKILFKIRERVKMINNKMRIFFSGISLPLSNRKEIVSEHNQYINSQIEILKPHLQDAIKILESRFGIENQDFVDISQEEN